MLYHVCTLIVHFTSTFCGYCVLAAVSVIYNIAPFWATVCKTVRPILSDRRLFCPACLSVCPDLSVCNFGVLWPNGWMDPQFLAHVCCGQMAGRMKTPLGTEIDLSPGHIVLDGVPSPAKQHSSPLFSPMSVVATVAHLRYCWALVISM